MSAVDESITWGPVDHVGVTVPDLDQAAAFFIDVLGCTEIYRRAPADSSRSGYGGGERGPTRKVALFQPRGGGSLIEAFEGAPRRGDPARASDDRDGHHIAFSVNDIDAAADWLRAHGVRVLGQPSHTSSGRQRWVYFLSPWGSFWELVSAVITADPALRRSEPV